MKKQTIKLQFALEIINTILFILFITLIYTDIEELILDTYKTEQTFIGLKNIIVDSQNKEIAALNHVEEKIDKIKNSTLDIHDNEISLQKQGNTARIQYSIYNFALIGFFVVVAVVKVVNITRGR